MTSEVHKNNLDGVEEIVSEKTGFKGLKWSGMGTNVTKFHWEDQGSLLMICYLYRNSTGITMMHFIKPSMCLFLS